MDWFSFRANPSPASVRVNATPRIHCREKAYCPSNLRRGGRDEALRRGAIRSRLPSIDDLLTPARSPWGLSWLAGLFRALFAGKKYPGEVEVEIKN